MTTTFSSPLTIGGMKLRNRFVMAPLTRNRATMDLVPTDREAETSMLVYYEQRATHAGKHTFVSSWIPQQWEEYMTFGVRRHLSLASTSPTATLLPVVVVHALHA